VRSLNKIIDENWRSWSAIVYLFICIVDFFIAPLLWNLKMESYCLTHDCEDVSRWIPLTLGGGAMFHLSFGAILGATSFNRHKENITDRNDSPTT